MRLYSFDLNHRRKLGAEWQGQLVDLAVAFEASQHAEHQPGSLHSLPGDIQTFIRLGAPAWEAAHRAVEFVSKRRAVPVGEQILYPMDAVPLRAPIERPGKILCVKARSGPEGASTSSEMPEFQSKFQSAIVAPQAAIVKPGIVKEIACSGALGVLIGKKLRNSTESEVIAGVFGYTVLNDVHACDPEFSIAQPALSRSFDTFCPIGPCLVTADEVAGREEFAVRTLVDGGTADGGIIQRTRIVRILQKISEMVTLEPGDILGFRTHLDPSPHVNIGQTIAVEIDGIGRVQNSVRSE
jgi:2-keto-4-pentenoate hydratase/2-oxohepta-3-ene-1,7-dioic acid hydratase in catechol pathway